MQPHLKSSGFRYIADDYNTGAPATATGAVVTSGSASTYGSYFSVQTALAEDCYGIQISPSLYNSSGGARRTSIIIGLDYAGGTSYTDWLVDLCAGASGPWTSVIGSPVYYYFPLFIPAGTTIGAKANCTTAAVGGRVHVRAFGAPEDPRNLKYGTRFRKFQGGSAPTVGDSITPGGASEGSWTAIGSTLAEPLWWFQLAMQCSATTMNGGTMHVDIAAGDASNKRIIMEDVELKMSTFEQILPNTHRTLGNRMPCEVAAGEQLYMRAQHSGTVESGWTGCIYGVG